jgi:EAL domain-containing protein (putative c-di-GMP-specific phosphodiesterase class I)
MLRLKALGVRLALDDFGTGYSSLAYLRSLPFSFVKVARPVVESITSGPRAIAFLRTTNELCETLGLQVIATGIETEEQLDLLKSLGCNHGQGFLLGRPAAGQSILAGAYPAAREPAEWLRGLPDDPDTLT